MTPLRLEAAYLPATGEHGSIELRVVNDGVGPVLADRLALTSIVPLRPMPGSTVAVVRRVSVYHELTAGGPIDVAAGTRVVLGPLACDFPPVHANDGPVSAFLIHADGSTTTLAVVPLAHPDHPPAEGPSRAAVSPAPAPGLRLEAGAGGLVTRAWQVMAACERAVHRDGPLVLRGADGDDAVQVEIAPRLGAGRARIEAPAAAGEAVRLVAGDDAGLRRALSIVARRRRGETPPAGEPVHDWRGLHIDLARQWFPPPVVADVIRIAGWYGLNRLHLHLTDDEAWRLPIVAYPALTDVGAWRGFGRPIPPLLGSGAEPYGGSYTAADVAAWVRLAADLGITLVPEIDVPGHSFAALAALPALRDPADTSGAVSVQGFVDNVLNPGLAATMPFLETVLGAVADLFPGPYLHLGGDEVPDGAWSGSPAAQRWAVARGVGGTRGIEAAFVADLIRVVRGLGREVGVWQEAAQTGALRPGDGYAIGWTTGEATRTLAAAGHDVVAAPAPAYYFDMADRTDWEAPGAFWAGTITEASVAEFDPAAGWTAAERAHLLGVQACLWSEHVHDESILRRLLLPRLAVFADRAWRAA